MEYSEDTVTENRAPKSVNKFNSWGISDLKFQTYQTKLFEKFDKMTSILTKLVELKENQNRLIQENNSEQTQQAQAQSQVVNETNNSSNDNEDHNNQRSPGVGSIVGTVTGALAGIVTGAVVGAAARLLQMNMDDVKKMFLGIDEKGADLQNQANDLTDKLPTIIEEDKNKPIPAKSTSTKKPTVAPPVAAKAPPVKAVKPKPQSPIDKFFGIFSPKQATSDAPVKTAISKTPIDTSAGGSSGPKIKLSADPIKVSHPFKMKTPSKNIHDIIKRVSDEMGVDTGAMLALAQLESNFKSNAPTKRSSALGLYQFITGTWNDIVAKYGKQYPALLKGRTDPYANTLGAALLLRDNATELQAKGIPITAGNLYLAHFAGPKTAIKLIKADGDEIAANIAPAAAGSNPEIFYEVKNGIKIRAKRVSEVMERLAGQAEQLAAQFQTNEISSLSSVTATAASRLTAATGPARGGPPTAGGGRTSIQVIDASKSQTTYQSKSTALTDAPPLNARNPVASHLSDIYGNETLRR